MDPFNEATSENKESNKISSKFNIGDEIKSNYILKNIFTYIHQKRKLETIKINKKLQKKINLGIDDYKEFCSKYSSIIIEITPIRNKSGKFINIPNKEEEQYYHIYFDDNKEEIKRYSLKENEKVSKIKIEITNQIKSFNDLFRYCDCIYSICFPKFYRNNITNMNGMFYFCSTLKKIDFTNFKTDNVKNMSNMFSGCSSLEELNLSNFNTSNVINMYNMFGNCTSLKKINVSNFNTSNVTNMNYMFNCCTSLNELNVSNFKLNKIKKMGSMFYNCSNLKQLELFNNNYFNNCAVDIMFVGIPRELKNKIRNENKNIDENAFEEDYTDYDAF